MERERAVVQLSRAALQAGPASCSYASASKLCNTPYIGSITWLPRGLGETPPANSTQQQQNCSRRDAILIAPAAAKRCQRLALLCFIRWQMLTESGAGNKIRENESGATECVFRGRELCSVPLLLSR
jgi:hypothetical protein